MHCQLKDRDAQIKQELLQNKYYFCFDAYPPFQPLVHIILLLLEVHTQIPTLDLGPEKLMIELHSI